MEIQNMNITNFIREFLKLNNEEKKQFILSNNINYINDDFLIMIFNNSDNEVKNIFINNDELLLRFLKVISNKTSKFRIINPEFQKVIVNNPSIFLKLENKEFFNLANSMDDDIFKTFINNLNKYIYENDIKTNIKELNEIKNIYNDKNYAFLRLQFLLRYGIHDNELRSAMAKNFMNTSRNMLELLPNFNRIKTNNQLYIYNEFDIVVDESLFKDEMFEKYYITIELLKKIKTKHIKQLMEEIRKKGNIDDTRLFITAVKMYCLFGISDALNVIHDKYTYTTESSLKRAALFSYINDRRLYRLNNPDEFYNYELIEKLRKSIQQDNINLLRKICSIDDAEYVVDLFDEFKEKYKLYKNTPEMTKYLNDKIKIEINKRENNIKNRYNDEYNQKYNIRRNKITAEELFNLFSEFDINQTKFDEHETINNIDYIKKSNVVMEPRLKKFLLGNEKSNNDCLLRMVINNNALDYNNEFINIINTYNQISNTMLELNLNGNYSLLDTLDVYKIIHYNLLPDERDISLSIISKIVLSKKHLNVDEEQKLNNFKQVHKEKKKKCSSTIPYVKGVTKHNYRYKLLDKNDQEILTCGVDVGDCFGPGGPGWDFYKYCLTSKYGGVIAIWDDENKFHICPIIRNGNTIFGNGIDPDNIKEEKLPFVLEALKKCYNDMIKKSSENEKIEICTLTNLHNYIKNDGSYNILSIDKPPMIGEYFYSDITKNELSSYIIAGNGEKFKEYVPNIEYYIPRTKNYVYSPDQQENKLLIEQKINEIEYRSIDLNPLDNNIKQKIKENYKEIKVDDYSYIVCNEDWYIAMSNQLEIKTAVLRDDPRAEEEFFTELQKLKKNNEVIKRI